MPKFDSPLNKDSNDILTSAIFDEEIAQWMAKVQSYIYTGDLWVPQKGTSTGEAVMQISNTIPEYAWLTGDAEPTPTEPIAFGIEFNPANGILTLYGWDGTAWVEVK